MGKPIIVSGIQPTGDLNIGGYLGAVRNWVELQNSGKYQTFFFVANLHALTTVTDAEKLRARSKELAIELLSAGIDPEKSCFFMQSDIEEHTELAWIFNCLTPVAELQRMTQFKDKSQKQEKNINSGLLTYPALMAADILLYHPEFIPVGEDQVQHVELTRDIARWFNNRYGEYFKEPKYLLTQNPRVMGLLEPKKKMSKSDGNPGNVINIHDDPELMTQKIKKAVTASEGGKKAPGAQNLLSLLKEFGDKNVYADFVEKENDGTIRYGDLKKALADAIANHFKDFRDKRAELISNEKKVQSILENGAETARKTAGESMKKIKELIGII